ncbi:putative nickel-responsive regulator [Roseibium aquae]|uniref:Nickel-responsive regulator n=1 Tax=Roseibium aquae TaxID=1323746 RepID=A0A916X1F4_9HYPH|nr:nickel-responsive transcriptional regulator NikR [Roseibium aquae]GGB56015.1 putative nickel-responsive regulator [Roseibium aquae]
MKRITITLDDSLLAEIDSHMEVCGATNRSEAIRDLVARSLSPKAPRDAQCIGVASYALDPGMRDLGLKVPKVRQDHHNRVAAALSVPVDHSSSLEVTVLKGPVGDVEAIANTLFLERGVKHGRLTLVPLAEDGTAHSHGDGHMHRHLQIADRF